jgi:hypothetical protein
MLGVLLEYDALREDDGAAADLDRLGKRRIVWRAAEAEGLPSVADKQYSVLALLVPVVSLAFAAGKNFSAFRKFDDDPSHGSPPWRFAGRLADAIYCVNLMVSSGAMCAARTLRGELGISTCRQK